MMGVHEQNTEAPGKGRVVLCYKVFMETGKYVGVLEKRCIFLKMFMKKSE